MSQSIPNCAQNAPIPSQSPIRYTKRRSLAKHTRRAGVLTVQAMRHFPTLEQASGYLCHRTKARQYDRFAIQQTAPNQWAVCLIIAGGV